MTAHVRAFLRSALRTTALASVDLPGFECPTCHKDGTVDYWCPRRWAMVRRARVVPEDALTVMPTSEAERVRRHLAGREAAA